MDKSLQLDQVRAHFPALSGDWVFMDNAGGSQTLKPVVDRISEYLLTSDVQHGASYAVSQLATERVAQASAAMATFVNAADPAEVVMGGSTSLLIRILSICLSQSWQPGDEVIVTNTDHEANVSPWMDLQKRGIKVKIWRVNPNSFLLEQEELETLMTERTRLVALTHTSNVLGTLNPIADIAKRVHERGALICVDGVAHAPHRLVDVQALGVDFYVFSFYKVYGPHYAMLYGRKDLLVSMPGINHYFIDGPQTPYKFQPGNVNFEFCYGMLGLVDYIQDLYQAHFQQDAASLRQQMQAIFNLFADYEEQLLSPLLDFLCKQPKVRIIGAPTADKQVRVPTVSFVVDGMDSEALVKQVDPHGIAIRFGDFYAKKLIHDLGLEPQQGVVRISLVHYNSAEEVSRLIEVLDTIISA